MNRWWFFDYSFYFDVLMMHCIYVQSGSREGHSQCLLCGGPQRIFFVCIILLFYSETELLHNTAEMVGMRMGLIGTKRGVHFGFYFM